jgi:hypothetical protein
MKYLFWFCAVLSGGVALLAYWWNDILEWPSIGLEGEILLVCLWSLLIAVAFWSGQRARLAPRWLMLFAPIALFRLVETFAMFTAWKITGFAP